MSETKPTVIPVCSDTRAAIASEESAFEYANEEVRRFLAASTLCCCYIFHQGRFAGYRCGNKPIIHPRPSDGWFLVQAYFCPEHQDSRRRLVGVFTSEIEDLANKAVELHTSARDKFTRFEKAKRDPTAHLS